MAFSKSKNFCTLKLKYFQSKELVIWTIPNPTRVIFLKLTSLAFLVASHHPALLFLNDIQPVSMVGTAQIGATYAAQIITGNLHF